MAVGSLVVDDSVPKYSLRGPLPLARASVDRAGHRRSDDDWLDGAWKDPRTRAFVVADGSVAVDGDRLLLGAPDEAGLARYFQVENKLDAVSNLKTASQVPLAQ